MNWTERLNEAVAYIESHLTEDPDPEQLGRIAGCSAYHFQRMFLYLTDMTLTEYIRRRKMTLAAADLQGGEEKIIDVALKYGYTSPTAFNRAFQSVHGVAPSALCRDGVTVRSMSPLVFKISITGVEEMNYRIETKEAFRVVGVSCPLEKEVEKNFENIPRKWQEAASDGTLQKLCTLMDGSPKGILGISTCGNIEEPWVYYIAVAGSAVDDSLEEYIVPAATWAIFPGEGSGRAIQDLEVRIVKEWLPSSGYEYASGPDIEVYLDDDPEHMHFEVWIPVVKKQ